MDDEPKTAADWVKRVDAALNDFRDRHTNELKAEATMRQDLERRFNELQITGHVPAVQTKAEPVWFDTKTQKPVLVLNNKQRLANSIERDDVSSKTVVSSQAAAPQISIGRMLRGIVLGDRAPDAKVLREELKALGIVPDTAGGFTVPTALSAGWIDSLRDQMVLSQAGALTVPMTTKDLQIATVSADPVARWHGENAALVDGDPTFAAVNLSAKTITCLVKFSLELSQDSANLEQILQSTLTQALAHEIDRAGLVGSTTDAAAAPSGIMNLGGRNTVTSIGAPTSWDFLVDGMYELLVDKVPMENIGAFIAHPAVWKKMRKLKTGIASDNTPLQQPDEIARLAKLWTTAAPLTGGTTAKGIIANWSDLLFGMRQDIRIQVLTQSFMGSNLQLAIVAYARCDFVGARSVSFCTLEGITV
jgi:HK97 family phage major capsid protein